MVMDASLLDIFFLGILVMVTPVFFCGYLRQSGRVEGNNGYGNWRGEVG